MTPEQINEFMDALAEEIKNDPEIARQTEGFQDFLEASGAGRELA